MAAEAIAAKRSMDDPDEILDFVKGCVHLVTLGNVTFDRSVFEPGWKWSEHVKSIAQTDKWTTVAPIGGTTASQSLTTRPVVMSSISAQRGTRKQPGPNRITGRPAVPPESM